MHNTKRVRFSLAQVLCSSVTCIVCSGFICSCIICSCTYDLKDQPLPLQTGSLKLVRSAPTAGRTDVPLDTAIDLTFDKPPLAATVNAQSVKLFGSASQIAGKFSLDLLERRIRFVPSSELRTRLRHRVALAESIRALDGSTLAEPLVFEFTSGETRSGNSPALRPTVSGTQVQPLWNRHCGACHSSEKGTHPVADLDLSSPIAARNSLVGVRAKGIEMMRVVAGEHPRSYLMRKLIGEYGITGFPMPPQGNPRLDQTEMRLIADWIDSGAK